MKKLRRDARFLQDALAESTLVLCLLEKSMKDDGARTIDLPSI
ncbi:hypothetical protein [Sagittula sp. NFXS13]